MNCFQRTSVAAAGIAVAMLASDARAALLLDDTRLFYVEINQQTNSDNGYPRGLVREFSNSAPLATELTTRGMTASASAAPGVLRAASSTPAPTPEETYHFSLV